MKFNYAFAFLSHLLLLQVATCKSLEFATINIIEDLPLDSNGRLADNWLLVLDIPGCKEQFTEEWLKINPALRNIGTYSKNLSKLFKSSETTCNAFTLTAGTKFDLLHHPLEKNRIELSKTGDDDILSFIQGQQIVEVGWTSFYKGPVRLYWIAPDGTRLMITTIHPGVSTAYWSDTSLGHKFEITDTATDELVGSYIMKFDSYFVIGNNLKPKVVRDISQEVAETFQSEYPRSLEVTRTFTDLGFSIGKLPPDLWASISSHYYNNQMSKMREEWDERGVLINWWEVDVYVIGMPARLKKYWQGRLKTLVEEWSGVELELTNIYGMRRYEDGARLLTHVDWQATHATSLIVNIAQGDMREPWAVEVYDFAGRLHEVIMEEGDIVYYESARCLHGRMKPLKGAYYVNLFAHYRPLGDPNWYTKPNPADNVPQLLDIGNCEVRGNGTFCSNGQGRVPYLSPHLETLKSHEDLFRYWQQTTPVVQVGGGDEL